MSTSLSEKYKFMVLTHRGHASIDEYLPFIEKCVRLGVSCIQLREKPLRADTKEFAIRLKAKLDEYHIPLIINDNALLAYEIDAAGVHVGQNDLDVYSVRKIIGQHKIVGLSAYNQTHIEEANLLPVDYIGLGAVFGTSAAIKADVPHIIGLDGLARLTKLSIHPVIAIGGISVQQVAAVMAAGPFGVALISAIAQSQNLQADINYISTVLKESTCSQR